MVSDNSCVILFLLFAVVLASGCTVSSIINPDEPHPNVLNPETDGIGVENIDDGQVHVGIENNGEHGRVGTFVIFKNGTGDIIDSTSEVITMDPGEKTTVVLDVDVPQDAETYDIFAGAARPRS